MTAVRARRAPRSARRCTRSLLLLALTLVVGAACGGREAPQRQRVLLVSLDGFRWDYVDRAPARRLRELAARGVRAERLIPVFPSKTFPNHYSIVTGLTPDQHGIVANVMRDPVLGAFVTTDPVAQQEPRWWGGEPIWATAQRQGVRAASYFWPGSEAPVAGARSSWWERYEHTRPGAERLRQVLAWLALPPDSAPALITLYLSDTDDVGHRFGPMAPQTDSAIARVDSVIGALVDGIERLGLTDLVNVIVVADHGMAEASLDRVIVLDDYLDLGRVDVVDWTPVAAIAPHPGEEERTYRALAGRHPHLRVYRKGELPARWQFGAHPRIPPIIAVADEGWTIASRAQLQRWRTAGGFAGAQHGYDNALPSMGAVFVAAGPGIAQGRQLPALRNIHLYALMAQLLGVVPAVTAGSLDSVRAILR